MHMVSESDCKCAFHTSPLESTSHLEFNFYSSACVCIPFSTISALRQTTPLSLLSLTQRTLPLFPLLLVSTKRLRKFMAKKSECHVDTLKKEMQNTWIERRDMCLKIYLEKVEFMNNKLIINK